MIYLSNSGTTSIDSFQSHDRLRIKGRRFFGYKDGAYGKSLKYGSNASVSKQEVSSEQNETAAKSNRKPTFNYLANEIASMYLAGAVVTLAFAGLVSLFG